MLTVLFILSYSTLRLKRKEKTSPHWEEVKVSLHTLNTNTLSSHTPALYPGFLIPFRKIGESYVVVPVGFTPLVSVKASAQVETCFIYCDTRGILPLVSW